MRSGQPSDAASKGVNTSPIRAERKPPISSLPGTSNGSVMFRSLTTVVLSLASLAFFLICGGCETWPDRNGATERRLPVLYYVAADGRDTNPGTRTQPFATLEQARDAIRELKKQSGGLPEGGVTVYLRGGVHRRTKTFALTASDSGTADAPVVYAAVPGESPRLVGGPTFRFEEFSPVTDPAILARLPDAAAGQVRQLDLRAHGIREYGALPLYGHSMYFLERVTSYRTGTQAPELFFDGAPMQLARWPNDGFATIEGVVEKGDKVRDWMPDRKGSDAYVPLEERYDPPKGFAIRIPGDQAARWQTADDMRMVGYWALNWSDQAVEIAFVDPERGVVGAVQPSAYGVQAGQRFYVYNLLEELDAPGEWYLDRTSGMLYIIPPEKHADARIDLSLLDSPLVDVQAASYIRFKDIEFAAGRDDGISIESGQQVDIADCGIGNIAGAGIRISGGRRHAVRGCTVENTGGSGIGATGGDIATLRAGGHVIENNLVHHFARLARTYQPGISLGGVGQRAAHNEIHTSPHVAILFGGNNHVIEYNHIHNVCRETDDMGAIYSGRSWTARGTLIRGNLVRDISGYAAGTHRASAIYLDDGISGTTVIHNIFLRVPQGLLFNGGRDNRAEGNIFVDCENMMRCTSLREAFTTWAAGSWITLNENVRKIPIDQEPWTSAYPRLTTLLADEPDLPKYNTIVHNVRYNAPLIIGKKGIHEIVVELGRVENNPDTARRPVDYDPQTGILRFDPASGVFDLIPDFPSARLQKVGPRSQPGPAADRADTIP